MTVADAAHLWLDRGRGQTGPWARATRERYDRVVRRHIERSTDSTAVAIGSLSLSELTVDVVGGYASLLIGSGLDVVYVSRQLGHANPAVTLRVYAHVFARREHAARARAALEASHEAMTMARVARS